LFIYLFLVLVGGEHLRKSVKTGSVTLAYHSIYGMTIQCTSGVIYPASLCIYSPFNDVILPDNTVAFIEAKASVPVSIPRDHVLLKTFLLIPLQGAPLMRAISR
ncbi:hypothetical protein EDD17DRAFT_1484632, partial [Pisolithus thermaeus]